PQDPTPAALLLGDRRGIDLDGRRRLLAAVDAVEARGNQPPDREVRVAARVCGLQLEVRRGLLGAPEERRHADGRLAVVVSPAGEGAGPELRDDAVVGVEARGSQA